jgi:hypothetical protein
MTFADNVCFTLPQLFESDGKGTPRKRVDYFNLIYSGKIEPNFYGPNKNELKVYTICQIWSKYHTNNDYDMQTFNTDRMRIYSLSDAGIVSTTSNKRMINEYDSYVPPNCFCKSNVKCYANFEDLPGKRGYEVKVVK